MMKKYTIVAIVTLITLGACKQKKEAEAEGTDNETEGCYMGAKQVDCEFKKEFDKAEALVNEFKVHNSSENTFKEVVTFNDSIFQLLKPLESVIKKASEMDDSMAKLYLEQIERTKSEMQILKRKINVIDHLVLKSSINNPNSNGEKFVDYTIENNSDEVFNMITMTTIYYDKNGDILYTDDGDAIGNYNFKPAMKDDNFPALYKGTSKRMPILGPSEDLHSKIFSLKQEVTNITFK